VLDNGKAASVPEKTRDQLNVLLYLFISTIVISDVDGWEVRDLIGLGIVALAGAVSWVWYLRKTASK
jgi:hypothetical protein